MTELLAPHAHPTGASGYLVVVIVWWVMMGAMMLPAVLPWLRTFSEMAATAFPRRRPIVAVGQFAGGYFAIWLAYSALAAALQGGLQRIAALSLDLRVGATIGGILLIVAGVFQLTPLKAACLAHCRSPLGFFLSRWRDGPSGPLQMGARHGLWCLGCCWALMALTFVLGVMNLVWMAVLTVVVTTEQRAPRALRLDRVYGICLAAWGAWLLAG